MKSLLKKQAILDIMIVAEHESWLRLVSYRYDKDKHCEIFKIDNGAGDHLYAIFSSQGAVLKGFDHESCLSPYQNDAEQPVVGLYDDLPPALLPLLDDSTEKNDATFCLWQLPGQNQWQKSRITPPDSCWQEESQQPEDGGQAFLLRYIFANAEEWYAWASIYYELQEEAWDAAELLYETGEITRSMVSDLNPERDYDTIIDECKVSGLLQ